jgi:hypothetical protein
MKTCYQHGYTNKQRGMGATIILFTIALIVLVGAALAYANRGGTSAVNVQGARVYSAVLLKQSADYRDAFSRFVFDGGNTATMTFNAANLPPGDLFAPSTQYGTYQAPPPQSLIPGGSLLWSYNSNVLVSGIGTPAGPESIVYVQKLTPETCAQINNQMYGTTVIPAATIASTALATAGTAIDTSATVTGRATGCMVTTDGVYVFYSTLAES